MSEDTTFVLPPGGIYGLAYAHGVPMFPKGHSSDHNSTEYVATVCGLPDSTKAIALHCIDCLAPIALIEQRVAKRLILLVEHLELDLYARVDVRPAGREWAHGPFSVFLWEQHGFDLKAYHPDMVWNCGPRPAERMIYLLSQGSHPATLELLLDDDWTFAEGADLLYQLQQNIGTPRSVHEVVVNCHFPRPDADVTDDGIRLDTTPRADGRMRIAYCRGTRGTNSHHFRPVAYTTRERFLEEGWLAFEVPPAPRPNPYFALPRPETLGDLAGGLSCRWYAREVLDYGGHPPRESESGDGVTT